MDEDDKDVLGLDALDEGEIDFSDEEIEIEVETAETEDSDSEGVAEDDTEKDTEESEESEQEEQVDKPKNKKRRRTAENRIKQLTRIKKEREEQIQEILKQKDDLEKRLKDQESLVNQHQTSAYEQAKSRIDAQQTALQNQYQTALESGDGKDQAELLVKLSELGAQKAQLQEPPKVEETKVEEKPQREDPRQQNPFMPNVVGWIKKNQSWYNIDPEMTNYARQIDLELVAQNIIPGTRDWENKLNERMTAEFPEEFEPRKPKTNVASGAGSTQKAKKTVRYKMSAELQRFCDENGLDKKEVARIDMLEKQKNKG